MLKKTLIAAALTACSIAACADTTTVKVIAFNDFHGTLLSPGTFPVQAGGSGTPIVNKAAGGGDNFTVLTLGKNVVGGAQDIDALLAYMANFKAPNAPYNPTAISLQKPRVTKLP
jgi:hypothetical protein